MSVKVAYALVIYRLDYCNYLYHGVTQADTHQPKNAALFTGYLFIYLFIYLPIYLFI